MLSRSMLSRFRVLRRSTLAGALITVALYVPAVNANAMAQTPAAAPAAAGRQLGTVKAVSGNTLTLTTDAGQEVAVSVADGARVLQLAPGSTDLKTAQTITLADIAAGDRVLVSGKAGDSAGAFAASRVILMKSGDIAQKHEAEQADWQKRGTGGIVSAVDAGSGALTVSIGAKKLTVNTSSRTQFRRYAGDSVKFEDAKPGTLAQIQVGDQLRVRGAKSDDGTSIQAEEVVSGSFKNLSGLIATVDVGSGTLTLKDLATKKTVTVTITANSSVRSLPPEAAARFAARARNAAAGGSGGGGTPAPASNAAGGERTGGSGRSAGADLSQFVSRLPSQTIADLKVGEAVMIVGSQSDAASNGVTAVTLLSGVEPILAAAPSGSGSLTLSPWSLGGGTADGGSQ
jgi:co-chaperonin GroES (HSP10)